MRMLVLIVALTVLAMPAKADKRAEIEKLMEISGTSSLFDQAMQTILAQQSRWVGQVFRPYIRRAGGTEQDADQIIAIFNEEIDAAFEQFPMRMRQYMVDDYERTFSDADIAAMIAFYESPTGKKVVLEMPGLMSRGGDYGQTYGTRLGEEAAERVMQRLDPRLQRMLQ